MAYATIVKDNVVFLGVAETEFEANIKVNAAALEYLNYEEIIGFPLVKEMTTLPRVSDNIHPRFSESWKKD